MMGMYIHGQHFIMNPLTKVYALTLSLAATVVATTPATAANLGLFEVSGTGRSVENVEQQLSGTYTTNSPDYDINVTTLFSTPITLNYNPITGAEYGDPLDPRNLRINRTRTSNSDVVFFRSLGTSLSDDFRNLEIGESIDATWYQGAGSLSTAGLGQLTITAVPEPGGILGVLASGAMLGGAFLKRHKK